MKNMKEFIKSALLGVAIFGTMMAIAFGVCTLEAKMDKDTWNNGECNCGGQYEFSNASHRKNGGNYYYYKCEECGKVIETVTAQKTENKIHEVAAIVEEINPETGFATLIDWDGEAWHYEGKLELGQMVIIEFDDMGTESIYDDEIVKIRG